MRSLMRPIIYLLLLAALAACSDAPAAPTASRPGAPTSEATATGAEPTPAAPTATGAPSEPTPAEEPTATPEPADPTRAPVAEGPGAVLYTAFNEATRAAELWRVELADGAQRKLLECPDDCNIVSLSISPDGSKVAYVALTTGDGAGLYIAGAEGGGATLLVPGNVNLGRNAFSPDGSQLAFVRFQPAEGMLQPSAAFAVDVAGGEERQLTPYAGMLSNLEWLDDDTLVASNEQMMGGVGTTLLIEALGEHGPPAVLSEGRALSLSPDRKRLLQAIYPFTDNITADQLFAYRVLDMQPEQPEVLLDLSMTMGTTIWSPDGALLLHAGSGSLELIDVATGDRRELRIFEGKHVFVSQPVWSRDGASIVYAVPVTGEQAATEIRALSVAEESERVLASIPGSNAPFLAVAP